MTPPDSPSGPRRLVPVPGVFGPDEAEPTDAPDAPALPPPARPDTPALGPETEPGASAPTGETANGETPRSETPPLPAPSEPVPALDAPAVLEGPERSGYPDEPGALPPPLGDPDAPLEADLPPAPDEPSGYPDAPDASPPAAAERAAAHTTLTHDAVEQAKAVTRSRGRDLAALVVRYGRAHLPPAPARAPRADEGPPRLVGRLGQVIPYLQAIPWLLGAVFAVSFAWDFPGASVTVLGRALPLDGLLRVLSVSGLIGFLTNWLAITMLFQPREKRVLIPQGLIPAQRERVIYRLSEAISRELINADIIKAKIQESGVIGRYRDLALGVVRGVVEDPGFRADLKALAADYAQDVLGSEAVRRQVAALAVQKVEEQAGQGLGGVALRLYRTFAEDDFQRRIDRALMELPQAVSPLLDRIDTALDAVPPKVEARADEIEEAATRAVLSFVESFDVRAMIMEKARGFDEGQLEGLLKSTSNEQLNYIKYLGGILGVFGGLVIWQPVGALAVFTAFGLGLWGLDEALVRARRRREGGRTPAEEQA